REGRRLVGAGVVRRACADHRGEGLARWGRLDARDRRACRRDARVDRRSRRTRRPRPSPVMTARVRAVTALAAVAAALALPAAAWAHAALLRTVPSASGILNSPPTQVRLTYSESVEPRFAIVSVTDAGGHRET